MSLTALMTDPALAESIGEFDRHPLRLVHYSSLSLEIFVTLAPRREYLLSYARLLEQHELQWFLSEHRRMVAEQRRKECNWDGSVWGPFTFY